MKPSTLAQQKAAFAWLVDTAQPALERLAGMGKIEDVSENFQHLDWLMKTLEFIARDDVQAMIRSYANGDTRGRIHHGNGSPQAFTGPASNRPFQAAVQPQGSGPGMRPPGT